MAPKRHDGIASNHSMMLPGVDARLFTRAHIQTGVDRLPLTSWIITSEVRCPISKGR